MSKVVIEKVNLYRLKSYGLLGCENYIRIKGETGCLTLDYDY